MWQLNNLRLGKSLSSSGSGVTAGNPSLNLNFLGTSTLNPLVTFTRASSGTYFDSTGTLQTAGNNTARFDYNPSTLASRGLLIEEQRTNSIRNNTMVGAVAGTPGTLPTNWDATSSGSGITRQVVGTGVENGISYIDVKYSGTNTSGGSLFPTVFFETASGISGSTGQVLAGSIYLTLAAGTGISFDLAAYEFNSGGGFLRIVTFPGTGGAPTISSLRAARRSGTITLGASTAFVRPLITGTIANGETVDFTLRIGLPQLEQGAFATSVISTTTAAATRSADVASVTTLSPWYNASAGTIFCSSIPMNVSSSNFANWAIGNSSLAFGAANTIYNLYTSSASGSAATNAIVGGAGQVAALTPTYTQSANTLAKSATAYELNNYANSVNGLAAATDTSATVPTVTGMSLGSLTSGWSGATNYLNGWIQRITYYPRRLPNAALQSLTA